MQPLDYEGVPFRCRICYKIGHLVAQFAKKRTNKYVSWWKDVTSQHYIVEKEKEKQASPQVRGREEEG